jgi:NADH-quinone oxidoreductase subunit L
VGAQIAPPLAAVLPADPGQGGEELKHQLEWLSAGIVIIGIALAAALFLGRRQLASSVAGSAPGRLIGGLWLNAWGFDYIYDRIFVRPYCWLAERLRHDPVDQGLRVIPLLARAGHDLLSMTQNGQLRWYAASIAMGAILVVAVIALY